MLMISVYDNMAILKSGYSRIAKMRLTETHREALHATLCNNDDDGGEDVDDREQRINPYHICIGCIWLVQSAEMSNSILDESSKDEAEADAQVHINRFDEAVRIGQRSACPHHQSGHS